MKLAAEGEVGAVVTFQLRVLNGVGTHTRNPTMPPSLQLPKNRVNTRTTPLYLETL